VFFGAFNKPYSPPQAKKEREQFKLRAILDRTVRGNNGEIEHKNLLCKGVTGMSFQETQPCGAGLRIYTMDSLFEIDGLQQ